MAYSYPCESEKRLRTLLESDYEKIVHFKKNELGLSGFIVVHNTKRGPPLGGTRIKFYTSINDALYDSICLAKTMTYKNIFAGIPFGGGKAIWILPKRMTQKEIETFKTEERLYEYAAILNSLNGGFITGEDMNVTVKDIETLREKTPYAVGLIDPSGFTALGLYHSTRAAVEFVFNKSDFTDLVFTIQGLGNVGSKWAKILLENNAQVIACDIDKKVAEEYKTKLGLKITDPENIYDQKSNVFSPCADRDILNETTIPKLSKSGCKIIVGSANNQLESEAIGSLIFETGISYVVDYIGNNGGVCSVEREWQNKNHPAQPLNKAWLEDKVGKNYGIVLGILHKSKELNLPTNVIANKIAEEKLKAYPI